MSDAYIADLVCIVIRSGGDPMDHELWPVFEAWHMSAHDRFPVAADLYDAASCPCHH